MTSIDHIYNVVRSLPLAERLRLIERVVHDLREASMDSETTSDSLMGLFAEEPEIADEVCRMALEDRASRRLRESDG